MRGSGWAGSSSKTGLFVRLGDKLYWVYVYVVRRWMLGFYIPLFYGDCTTQSLQSGFSQQIHISDLISSYFYLKLTQMLPFHHRLLGHDQENWGWGIIPGQYFMFTGDDILTLALQCHCDATSKCPKTAIEFPLHRACLENVSQKLRPVIGGVVHFNQSKIPPLSA